MPLLVSFQHLLIPYVGAEASIFLFFLGPLLATRYGSRFFGILATALGLTLHFFGYGLAADLDSSAGGPSSLTMHLALLAIEGFIVTWMVDRQRQLQRAASLLASSEREAHGRLARAEVRFHKFVEESFSGVILATLDGRILEANDAFLKMTGYSRLDVTEGRLRWTDLTPPEHLELDKRAVQELLKTGRARAFEKEYIRKDGSRMPILLSTVVVDEGPTTVLCFVEDLSESKASHAAIVASEKRFRQLMEAIPQLVFLVSEDHSETYLNGQWSKYLGANPSQQSLRSFEYLAPDDLDVTIAAWTRSVTKREPFELQYRIRRHDGEYRWHLARVVPTVNSEGRPAWIGVVMDIHDEKMHAEEMRRNQEELRKAKDSAEAANRAKNQFIANISHELRTPLSAIMGFSELLRQSKRTQTTDRSDFLERISKNAEILARLIDEILDLAKVEAQKLEIERAPFDVRELLDDVRELARLKAQGKQVEVDVRLMNDVPMRLTSDLGRLRQILTNMISNAVKFTEKGRVEMHVYGYQLSDLEGRWRLRVDVVDTGIGIGADERARLFKPFSQADSSIMKRFGGSGLGLALSRRLARALGGDLVLAESELGRGSRFVLTIDGGGSDESEVVLTPPSARDGIISDVSLLGIKVLVVDDSADNRLVVERFLESLGAQVVSSENGRQALAKAFMEPVDVVLMDIEMPYLDGYETLRELRSRGITVPVIAITAHDLVNERDKCLMAGFEDCLSKPITRAGLVQAILKPRPLTLSYVPTLKASTRQPDPIPETTT